VDIPPGALITFLQKGLEYVGIEEHINEVRYALVYIFVTTIACFNMRICEYTQDGSVREFDGNYSLLSPFICEAIGVKEERRYRRNVPPPSPAHTGQSGTAVPVKSESSTGGVEESVAMEVTTDSNSEQPATLRFVELAFL
jgi:hypothetical protein